MKTFQLITLLFTFFLSMAIFCEENVQQKIDAIFSSMESQAVEIYEKNKDNEPVLKRQLAGLKIRTNNQLNSLKSFYLNRHLFDDSNTVKEAIAEFKDKNLLQVAQKKPTPTITQPTEVAKKPEQVKENDATTSSLPKTTNQNSNITKVSMPKPERQKKGLTYQEFMELPEDQKAYHVKKYVTLDSDNFYTVNKSKYTIKTDVSDSYALAMAIFMDDFYLAFEQLFLKKFSNLGSPVLYITKTRDGYFNLLMKKGINAPGWSGGLYSPSRRMLVGYKEAGNFLKDVLYHEGTHQLIHFYTNRNILPWLNEGLATNFETWDPTKSPRINVFESQFKSDRAAFISQKQDARPYQIKDFERMINMSGYSWNSTIDPTPNYSQAWSIVNFLLNNPKGIKVLDKILAGYMKGYELKDIYDNKAIEEIAQNWLDDIALRQKPMYDFGRPIYEEIEKWIINEKHQYQEKNVEKNLYSMSQTSKDNIEFTYLNALHDMIIGEHQKALSVFEKIVKENDNLPYIYSAIAYCQLKENNTTDAKKNLGFALQKYYEDPLAARLY